MAIARRQGGAVARQQLLDVGLSKRQIDGLSSSGVLRPLSFGVWRVSGAPMTKDTALWRAVLTTRGVLVAASAAYVWGILEELAVPIEVAVNRPTHNHAPVGVRIHRWQLDRTDVTTRFGLPVMSRSRAAVDHIAALHWPSAMSFADRAFTQGWTSPEEVERRLRTRRPGNQVLRRVLATHTAGAEAESERLMHRLLHRAHITGWIANYRVQDQGRVFARVDIAFPEQKLAIEVDGFKYHSGSDRFQRDRTKQNSLTALGWTVLRFTWFDIVERPAHVLAMIARQLERMVS